MSHLSFLKSISPILLLIPLSTFALSAVDPRRFIDNDLTTIDTVTGLEWLDVPVTTGIPYLSVEEECKPGGVFEGYRHAVGTEILELFFAFDFPDFVMEHTPGYSEQLSENFYTFLNLFGNTSNHDAFDWVRGSADGQGQYDKISGTDYYMVPTYGVQLNKVNGQFFRYSGEISQNPSLAYDSLGSFLVRKSQQPHVVPEINAAAAPVALSLLLLASLMRWERRRVQPNHKAAAPF